MDMSGLLVFNQNYQLLFVLPERQNGGSNSVKGTNTESVGKRDLNMCTNNLSDPNGDSLE